MSIDIVPFQDEHIADAGVLLAERHRRDRLSLRALPARFEDAAVATVAVAASWRPAGATGVAALRAGRLTGYLLGRHVIDETWGRSAWVRPPACALAPDEDAELVRTLYAALAAPWVQQGIFFHFALLPVTDPGLIHAWVSLSFGIEQVYGLADWRSTNLLAARFWPRQGFRPVAYRLVRRVDQRIAWANPSQMATSL